MAWATVVALEERTPAERAAERRFQAGGCGGGGQRCILFLIFTTAGTALDPRALACGGHPLQLFLLYNMDRRTPCSVGIDMVFR
eukprot:1160179-Pelagomonas_calceolata.AAC.6